MAVETVAHICARVEAEFALANQFVDEQMQRRRNRWANERRLATMRRIGWLTRDMTKQALSASRTFRRVSDQLVASPIANRGILHLPADMSPATIDKFMGGLMDYTVAPLIVQDPVRHIDFTGEPRRWAYMSAPPMFAESMSHERLEIVNRTRHHIEFDIQRWHHPDPNQLPGGYVRIPCGDCGRWFPLGNECLWHDNDDTRINVGLSKPSTKYFSQANFYVVKADYFNPATKFYTVRTRAIPHRHFMESTAIDSAAAAGESLTREIKRILGIQGRDST